MHTTVRTTITTRVDLNTFEVEHQCDVDSGDDLPERIVLAVVSGGAKSVVAAMEERLGSGPDSDNG